MAEFSDKLALVLKALLLSRGRLAAELGVDKSLVGRWVSGTYVPSAHNLSSLTLLIAQKRPGFTLLDWDRDLDSLAALFGVDPTIMQRAEQPAVQQPLEQARDVGLRLLSQKMSAREIAAAGHVYTGLYVLMHQRFMNSGVVNFELVHIYPRGNELLWDIVDGGNHTQGYALLLRNKLHLIGEGEKGKDGVTLHILNGTGDLHAMVMDGVLASVAGDRFFTPTASKVVLLRIAHPLDDPDADRARFERVGATIAEINNGGNGVRFLPPDLAHAIDNRAGLMREHSADWVLRIPAEASVARSDWEGGNYTFPAPELTKLLLGD